MSENAEEVVLRRGTSYKVIRDVKRNVFTLLIPFLFVVDVIYYILPICIHRHMYIYIYIYMYVYDDLRWFITIGDSKPKASMPNNTGYIMGGIGL